MQGPSLNLAVEWCAGCRVHASTLLESAQRVVSRLQGPCPNLAGECSPGSRVHASTLLLSRGGRVQTSTLLVCADLVAGSRPQPGWLVGAELVAGSSLNHAVEWRAACRVRAATLLESALVPGSVPQPCCWFLTGWSQAKQKEVKKQTNKQADKQTHKQTPKQTNKHTSRRQHFPDLLSVSSSLFLSPFPMFRFSLFRLLSLALLSNSRCLTSLLS